MEKSLVVYVADDHTLFRKAIAGLLLTFNRIKEVKDAENGKELLQLVKEKKPDVVLLDLKMPVMDGSEACEILYNKYPEVKVIILSMHDSDRYVLHLMDIGARAFLFKNAEPRELETAIYSVVDKDFYHNEIVASILKKQRAILGQANTFSFRKPVALTEREVEIIRLICRENSTREIGNNLSISERTVENHRAKIMEKIEVKNVVGIVRYAYEHGLLKME
ncbi:MAG: response regulator transcription factor [Cyclobacteriaceae bacterium]|jgi:two-component system response regulator DegU|nr:response regulator transcription factor [Flammeovirgaceae bacterium]MCZ8021879.1 response regulator transcription factor [Cytophagales bacterium]MCZ8329328.1 response regulator transcription factor [Cyclobacteriaceae bacterium]